MPFSKVIKQQEHLVAIACEQQLSGYALQCCACRKALGELFGVDKATREALWKQLLGTR